MNNIITLQELFASAKPRLMAEELTWDGKKATVHFQRMTMEENADLGRPFLNEDGSGLDKDKIKHFQARMLATCVRDEAGNKVLTEEQVLGFDSAFYQALIKASEKHNPAGPAAVEAEAKNSGTTTSTGSS